MKTTKRRKPKSRQVQQPAGPAMTVAGDDCPACGGTMYKLIGSNDGARCLDCEPLAVED